jgi:FMN phosphatase YigB (HAD superfamily)
MMQETHPPETPEKILRTLLTSRLRDTLERKGQSNEETLMEQADILDCTFRRILAYANIERYPETKEILAALKAQNQCRDTLKELNALKNHQTHNSEKTKT